MLEHVRATIDRIKVVGNFDAYHLYNFHFCSKFLVKPEFAKKLKMLKQEMSFPGIKISGFQKEFLSKRKY